MLKIQISSENLEMARKRAAKLGQNSKKIQTGSELHGMVGEQLFLDNYGGKLVDSFYYDIDHERIGKIDVKTKKCHSPPKDYYYCTVAAYQIDKDECEFYAFYRVGANLNHGWFLGIISKEEFKKKAVFLKKGDKDGNFVVKADCYNMKVSDLKTISQILKEK